MIWGHNQLFSSSEHIHILMSRCQTCTLCMGSGLLVQKNSNFIRIDQMLHTYYNTNANHNSLLHTCYSCWWHCVPSNCLYHKVVDWKLPNNSEMNIVASDCGSLVGCFPLTPGSAQLNACWLLEGLRTHKVWYGVVCCEGKVWCGSSRIAYQEWSVHLNVAIAHIKFNSNTIHMEWIDNISGFTLPNSVDWIFIMMSLFWCCQDKSRKMAFTTWNIFKTSNLSSKTRQATTKHPTPPPTPLEVLS